MGASIAQVVASRGAIVSMADLNEEGLKKTLATLQGTNHIFTVVDVSKAASIENWMDRTVKELGGLDGAANFAGVLAWNELVNIQDTTEANWDFHMNVNAKGCFFALQAELKRMKAGGSIVSWRSDNMSGVVLVWHQLTATGMCCQRGWANRLAYHDAVCCQ